MAALSENCGLINYLSSLVQTSKPVYFEQHSPQPHLEFAMTSLTTKPLPASLPGEVANCSILQSSKMASYIVSRKSNEKEIDTMQQSLTDEEAKTVINHNNDKNCAVRDSNYDVNNYSSSNLYCNKNHNSDNYDNKSHSNNYSNKNTEKSVDRNSNCIMKNITNTENNDAITDNPNSSINQSSNGNGISTSVSYSSLDNKILQPQHLVPKKKQNLEIEPFQTVAPESGFTTLTQLPFITAPLRSQLSPETMKSFLPLSNRHSVSSTSVVCRVPPASTVSLNSVTEQASFRNVTTELFLNVAGTSCLSSRQYPVSPPNDDSTAFSPSTSQLCKKEYTSLLEQRKERFPAPPMGTLQNPEVYGINVTIGGELIKPNDVKNWELPNPVKLQRLRDRLVQFMSENHLKQADICRFTGLGAPYLSFMVKDPTISNFSSKRRVEVYSVLKAFFEKIDNEEVTLNDIARLVLISKAAARAVNSRKKNAIVGDGQEKTTIRRRRRGRPRVLERSRDDQKLSFQDFLTATALPTSAFWGNPVTSTNSESLKFDCSNASRLPAFFSNNKDSNEFSSSALLECSDHENKSTSNMNHCFSFILEELRKKWMLNQPKTTVLSSQASPNNETNSNLQLTSSEDSEEAIFKILVSLLSKCDSNQLKRIAESFITYNTYKKNTDRFRPNDFTSASQLTPALLQRLINARSLQKFENRECFSDEIPNDFFLKIPSTFNDTLDETSGERFSTSNTSDEESSIGTADEYSFQQTLPKTTIKAQQESLLNTLPQETTIKEAKQKRSFSSISSTSSKPTVAALCEENNSVEKLHKNETGKKNIDVCESLTNEEASVAVLKVLRSHFDELHENSKAADSHAFGSATDLSSECMHRSVPDISFSNLEQETVNTQQQAPKIFNMFMALLECQNTEPLTSKDQCSIASFSKHLDSNRLQQTNHEPINQCSTYAPYIDIAESSNFSHNNEIPATTWTSPVRFGKGWIREIELVTITKTTEHSNASNYEPINQQIYSTSTTCTDDEDDADSLPSFSGQLCSVRLQWSHGSITEKEDFLWDINDTGNAVETFIEQYVQDHNLPDFFIEQFTKSFREEILSKQSFENMFLATTQHLAVLLKQPHSKYLPGMKRRIILDFTFNGTRNLDVIEWNLANPTTDAKGVLKELIRDAELPSSSLPQMLSAFLQALTREKLAFMHECTMTLLGTVQAKLTEHAEESHNNTISWNTDTQRRKRDSASLYPAFSRSSEELNALSATSVTPTVERQESVASFEVPQTKRSCVNQPRVYEQANEKEVQVNERGTIQSVSKSFSDSQTLFNLKMQDNNINDSSSNNDCTSNNFLLQCLQQENTNKTNSFSYIFLARDSPSTTESKSFENCVLETKTLQKTYDES